MYTLHVYSFFKNKQITKKNIDGSNVNLTSKGIILGNVQFESNLPVRSELYHYFQILLVYMQVKGYVTKFECRVTIS